ncbi:MAG TPA: saccharopine dehydrogenase C-terminal domain-containing protein [Thermoanaerobaculia bacterium]|nr:saccharopine dehydrogenase C-terminal domain-containing protein [Thermoanaerobaculia bacterium]
MTRVTVLGAGLVGSLIARTLAGDERFEILVCDRSEDALGAFAGLPRVATVRLDFALQASIAAAVAPADVVVGAVPGFLGHSMLRTVIDAGKPLADISFAPEDPFALDGLAKAKGVPAVVDCGVSPGLSNLACGRAAGRLDVVDSIVISVGGLPFRRVPPWEYRIVFSATDVLEEYTRPARLVEDGNLVTKPALSEVTRFDLPGVGTLEAFLTDGLRTVLSTVKARNLREQTLRWPGHAEKMRVLRDTGFFRDEPIEAGGTRVAPRAVAEALLFPAWKRPEGEEEFTVLRVESRGSRAGRPVRLVHGLFDRTDARTGTTSMARTTGFPCVIAAQLLASGALREPGVLPLELLGARPDLFAAFVEGLAARGVAFSEIEEDPWPG